MYMAGTGRKGGEDDKTADMQRMLESSNALLKSLQVCVWASFGVRVGLFSTAAGLF